MTAEPLLEARGLNQVYRTRDGSRVGVHHVDISLIAGRVLALVGESGSGKSTVARLLARIIPGAEADIRLHGIPVPRRGRSLDYCRRVQMVFQDPYASLNPVKTVAHHILRPLDIHQDLHGSAGERAAIELLELVGITPGRDYLGRYPHELSGGQRQRVAIAATLAPKPEVLLADEPTSMLDVTIRMGILKLIRRLATERQLGVLFITHDLASAWYIADEVTVLHAGQVVEHGNTHDVLDCPSHPYTRKLLDAVPDPRSRSLRRPHATRLDRAAVPFSG